MGKQAFENKNFIGIQKLVSLFVFVFFFVFLHFVKMLLFFI